VSPLLRLHVRPAQQLLQLVAACVLVVQLGPERGEVGVEVAQLLGERGAGAALVVGEAARFVDLGGELSAAGGVVAYE